VISHVQTGGWPATPASGKWDAAVDCAARALRRAVSGDGKGCSPIRCKRLHPAERHRSDVGPDPRTALNEGAPARSGVRLPTVIAPVCGAGRLRRIPVEEPAPGRRWPSADREPGRLPRSPPRTTAGSRPSQAAPVTGLLRKGDSQQDREFFWTLMMVSACCGFFLTSASSAFSLAFYAANGFSMGFRPRLFDNAFNAPVARNRRHSTRCEEYSPSRRSRAPMDPESAVWSASLSTLSLYSAVNLRR